MGFDRKYGTILNNKGEVTRINRECWITPCAERLVQRLASAAEGSASSPKSGCRRVLGVTFIGLVLIVTIQCSIEVLESCVTGSGYNYAALADLLRQLECGDNV